MMFSFTGPQSSGKTTLLKECKKFYGSKLWYVDEVTRLISREYGVDINESGANDVTQTLILNKEFENLMFNYKLSKFEAILDQTMFVIFCAKVTIVSFSVGAIWMLGLEKTSTFPYVYPNNSGTDSVLPLYVSQCIQQFKQSYQSSGSRR
jgi:tRNA uridine 5-carbamoylmethylation protein Kti12